MAGNILKQKYSESIIEHINSQVSINPYLFACATQGSDLFTLNPITSENYQEDIVLIKHRYIDQFLIELINNLKDPYIKEFLTNMDFINIKSFIYGYFSSYILDQYTNPFIAYKQKDLISEDSSNLIYNSHEEYKELFDQTIINELRKQDPKFKPSMLFKNHQTSMKFDECISSSFQKVFENEELAKILLDNLQHEKDLVKKFKDNPHSIIAKMYNHLGYIKRSNEKIPDIMDYAIHNIWRNPYDPEKYNQSGLLALAHKAVKDSIDKIYILEQYIHNPFNIANIEDIIEPNSSLTGIAYDRHPNLIYQRKK